MKSTSAIIALTMFVHLACTTGEVNRERTEDVDTLYRRGDGRQGGISTSATAAALQPLRRTRRRQNLYRLRPDQTRRPGDEGRAAGFDAPDGVMRARRVSPVVARF